MTPPHRPRLDPAIFNLPVEKMRAGYYSDKYFVRARDILLNDDYSPRVTVQVFGKTEAFLGGIDEAIAILKLCSDDWPALTVRALHDGDAIVALGSGARDRGALRTTSPTSRRSTSACSRGAPGSAPTRAAWSRPPHPKDVMFFPARHDHWLVQTGDGYAAHIAGAIGVSTDAQASWWGSEGIGTVPHGLIAAYGGDTVLASRKFLEHVTDDVRLVSLVDFENDCVGTSLALANALGSTTLRRAARHQRNAGRSLRAAADGALQADRRHAAAGAQRPRCPRCRRPPARAHRRLRRLHGREDPSSSSSSASRWTATASARRSSRDASTSPPTWCELDGKPCAKVGRGWRENPRLSVVE